MPPNGSLFPKERGVVLTDDPPLDAADGAGSTNINTTSGSLQCDQASDVKLTNVACDPTPKSVPTEEDVQWRLLTTAVPVPKTDDVLSGGQLMAPDLNWLGVHIANGLTSAHAMRQKLGERLLTFVQELLIRDDPGDTYAVIESDAKKLPWLCALAKLASRDISVFCIPVSQLARKQLERELLKIRNDPVESAHWHHKKKWYVSDRTKTVSGQDRVQRVVSKIIRDSTTSHAHDKVGKKKVPARQQNHDPAIFRQVAQNFRPKGPSAEAIAATNSTHPVAGAARKAAVTGLRDYLASYGFKMYDESKSGAARDNKALGRREVYDVKDLHHDSTDDYYVSGHVLTFVDQDLYIDDLSPYAAENMVFVTPEYPKLAGEGTDSVYYYTVDAKDQPVVVERVALVNGATYGLSGNPQRPWNFTENDVIYIEHPGREAFTTHDVHIQWQPGTHHKFVWLCRKTTTRLSKPVCDMMCKVAQGHPLAGVPLRKANNVTVVRKKDSPKQETFLLGKFGDSKNPIYSIKYAFDQGPDSSVELNEHHFHVFSTMGQNRPKGWGSSEVKRVMMIHDCWRSGGIEPLVVAFFGISIDYRPLPNILYCRLDGSTAGEVAEIGTAVQAAPNPAGGGPGVADTTSDAAHEAYKTNRMEAFKNTTKPADHVLRFVNVLLPKFMDLVAAESGVPLGSVLLVGHDVVYANRSRAQQAARLQRHAELVAGEPMPKTFLKHEVTAKSSSAPRAITQFDEERALDTGRVGLLLKEVLKNCEFYQPGNSPEEIALAVRKLTEIAIEAADTADVQHVGRAKTGPTSGVHDTDYSKMDETISETIYSWFTDFTLGFVHPQDRDEVKTILASNVCITSILNGGLINSGFKNNSGSGVTTELNTIISAFIEYVTTCLAIAKFTYRLRRSAELDMTNITRSTIKTALEYYAENYDLSHVLTGSFMFKHNKVDVFSIPYAAIGLKFGDDGVAPHLPMISDADWGDSAEFFTKAIGMILKVAFSSPEHGTFFLGRHYPDPLRTLASYADVPKAIRKISLARNMDVDKYKLKLSGYWTTDSKTPGLSEYLQAVAKMYDYDLTTYSTIVDVTDDGIVLSREMLNLLAADRNMFYRVAGGPYCVEDGDVPAMMEAICTQCGYDNSEEFEQWLKDLSECTTWEQLDQFQLPGMGYDPDAEPEGTVRVAGPATTLLSAQPDLKMQLNCDSRDQSAMLLAATTVGDLAEASELALEELLKELAGGAGPSASA